MVAHLVGGVYDECKIDIMKDVNYLAQCIQKVFQCTVKFTIIPVKIAKLLKLSIWNDFVYAVEDSIKNGNMFYWNKYVFQCNPLYFIQLNLIEKLYNCGFCWTTLVHTNYYIYVLFFVANNLVSKLINYKGNGLLNSMLNMHDIPIDIIKRLIVDFIIAAGDTVRFI